MTATPGRRSRRAGPAQAVVDAWQARRPDTSDAAFWEKYAEHDEQIADAYNALRQVTDDQALCMALQDAEEHRRERAKDERKQAARMAGSREEVTTDV